MVNGTDVRSTIAARLAEARAATGLSLRQVQYQLPIEVTQTSLMNWERNLTPIKADVLVVLAEFYRRPIGWFVK